MKQYITIVSTVLGIMLVLGGGFASYATLTADQKNTQEKVDELKAEGKEVKDKIHDVEMINLQQTVVQERVLYILDKLEEKVK